MTDQAATRRTGGRTTVDLQKLEEQARDLYLTRFLQAVRDARREHGRYLVLRSGDELAIRAAGDGSAELLDSIITGEAGPG